MQCDGEVYRLRYVGKAHNSYRPEIGYPNFLRCFLQDLQANWYDIFMSRIRKLLLAFLQGRYTHAA